MNNAAYTAARTESAKQYETSTVKFSDSAEVVESTSGKSIYDDGKVYRVASDGKAIQMVDPNNPTGKAAVSKSLASSSVKRPSAARDSSRAGQAVSAGGYTTYYDEDGYVIKQSKN